jgi:hypothetical protein
MESDPTAERSIGTSFNAFEDVVGRTGLLVLDDLLALDGLLALEAITVLVLVIVVGGGHESS